MVFKDKEKAAFFSKVYSKAMKDLRLKHSNDFNKLFSKSYGLVVFTENTESSFNRTKYVQSYNKSLRQLRLNFIDEFKTIYWDLIKDSKYNVDFDYLNDKKTSVLYSD